MERYGTVVHINTAGTLKGQQRRFAGLKAFLETLFFHDHVHEDILLGEIFARGDYRNDPNPRGQVTSYFYRFDAM
jgi:hypothetical protein